MKAVKYIIFVVVLAAVLLIGIGVILPQSSYVERSAVIDAPKSVVFELVGDLPAGNRGAVVDSYVIEHPPGRGDTRCGSRRRDGGECQAEEEHELQEERAASTWRAREVVICHTVALTQDATAYQTQIRGCRVCPTSRLAGDPRRN